MKLSLFTLIILSLFNFSFVQDSTKSNPNQLLDYYQTQRYDKAADYLLATNPEPIANIKILKAIAYCMQMQGHLTEAENYYQRAYQVDSTNISILFSLGNINLNRGNLHNAETWYKKILTRDTTNFMVYKQLGSINVQNNKLDVAYDYYAIANRLNPTDADIAALLSDFYVHAKQYELANNVLDKAIAADPENMELLDALVKLEYGESKWPQVVTDCEKLMRLGNTSGPVLTKLGIAYYYLKDYKCSIESLALIDALNQNETTCYYTAEDYKALKDYNNAVAWFYKTITIGVSPNINNYYSEIADSYQTIKRFNKAETTYQKALQFDEKPLTYYLLADLYETNLKDRKKAVVYYKKFLSLKPDAKMQKYITYAKSRVSKLK